MVSLQKNNGYALLIFLIVMMGLGGVALAGISQKLLVVSKEKSFEHNKKVLQQAKNALLMYAYNYPSNNPDRGPGRLPCPDTDNDGSPNSSFNCVSGTALVGRFPWFDTDMNFYDARDSDGERLWYAVSKNFANTISPVTDDVINSDTPGSISIADQTGKLIYDASSGNGVVAVIIAPGKPVERSGSLQDRTVSNGDNSGDTIADSDPGIIDKTRYLDAITINSTVFDNDDFSNDNLDGFILGPIYSSPNNIVVNDQFIIITVEEVKAVAEKAVLNAYSDAIKDYQKNIWGTTSANYRFPWLDDYSTTNLDIYDADINTVIGRLPSSFANYFDSTITKSSQPIDTEVKLRVNVNGFYTPDEDLSTNVTSSFIQATGDLTITPAANDTNTIVRYFWDEAVSPDGWEICPPVTFSAQDCNQASAAPGVPNSAITPNEVATRVVEVTYTNNFVASTTFTRNFSDNTGGGVVYIPPSVSSHAYAFSEYDETIADGIDVSYIYDNNYLNSFDNVSNGTNYFIGLRYYPVLPYWALDVDFWNVGNPENDWHNSVMMAYADGLKPGGPGNCTAGTNCITLNNYGGANNDFESVLINAGEHGITDTGAVGFQDDLSSIFETENDDLDIVFDYRSVDLTDKFLEL
jgi:type II secretory pathway pseudopilin PulG